MDSFLNSVLNRETHKAGGRTLITVGDSDIDFSPSFKLFLTTRDPTVEFSPEFRSRITLVNFTLTPSSLQNQVDCIRTAVSIKVYVFSYSV
jgi:dynein heavy chain 1, cytosolic